MAKKKKMDIEDFQKSMLDDVTKSIKEMTPDNFDSRELMGHASILLPTGLEPLPRRDYNKEFEDIKYVVTEDLKKIFLISTGEEANLGHNIIKAQMDLDTDGAARLKHLIMVEQSKMHELMEQMDIFPAEVPFHAILVNVQKRLSDAITVYDAYLKKCGDNYITIMENVRIEPVAEEQDSVEEIQMGGIMNHKKMNDLIKSIKAQQVPS